MCLVLFWLTLTLDVREVIGSNPISSTMIKRHDAGRVSQRVEKPRLNRIACAGAGEREGAAARLAWDRMPRNALPRKACGQRSEDFCAAVRRESNGILEGCRKSPWTFSTA